MESLTGLGKLLIIFGSLMVVAGLALVFAPHIPFLGRLPGDILVQRDGFTFYFPLVTMVIVSVVLTILLNVIFRFFR